MSVFTILSQLCQTPAVYTQHMSWCVPCSTVQPDWL